MAYNSWTYDQNEEPNVPKWDTQADRLQQNANQEAKDEIFFDVIVDQIQLGGTVPHANSDETNVRGYASAQFRALLGYWRDCNQDGFLGDVALGFQYPVEEGDATICPPGTPYNDGSQMFEFLPIGDGARDVAEQVNEDDQQGTICPERAGSGTQPRAQDGEGVLDGGDNVLCLGERPNFVQDDFAKVWHDWGLPIDEPTPTSGVTPLNDGTFRDTNGHFKYVDSLTFGTAGSTLPGWWPSEPNQNRDSDPAEPNQCENGEGEVTDVVGYAENTIQGATADDCTAIPNVRKATLPVLGPVAYPGEIAETHYNDSENPDEHPTPITAPFTHEPNEQNTDDENAHKCEPKEDPDNWDDDPSDGDPFYGGDVTGDTIGFAQAYYTPQHPSDPDDNRPSLAGTTSNVAAGALYQAAKAQNGQSQADCTKGDQLPTNIERVTSGGQEGGAAKDEANTLFSYEQEAAAFNPSTAPGGPGTDGSRADTTFCAPESEVGEGPPTRCRGTWDSTGWLRSHGTTSLDPTATSTDIATFYADVSFGESTFDPVNDGPFRVGQGYYEQPGGLDEASALPAGQDDAHTYGDEGCDSYTGLETGGDDVVNDDHITATVGTWNCDRNAWASANQVDCTDPQQEVTCWELPKVGDPYDFRDVECFDNDVAGTSTTDTEGPLGDVNEELFGDREEGLTGQSIDDPGRNCQDLPAPPG